MPGSSEEDPMTEFEPLARMLILVGVLFLVLGGVLLIVSRLELPMIGRLPGDILWRRGNVTVYFPLVSCLVGSLLLTLLLNLVLWVLHR